MRPAVLSEPEHQDAQEDEWLFWGWDSLSLSERRLRLALFLREVQAQVAEQERVWLREQLQEARAHIETRSLSEQILQQPGDSRTRV